MSEPTKGQILGEELRQAHQRSKQCEWIGETCLRRAKWRCTTEPTGKQPVVKCYCDDHRELLAPHVRTATWERIT